MEAPLRKLLLTFLIPAVAVLGLSVGLYWWATGAPPGMRPTPHDVPWAQLSLDDRGVRVEGTAHYPVRLRLTSGDGDDQQVTWLFPFFARGDTTSKEVRVLVHSHRQPDELLSFEDLTVTGLARPPGATVPRSARKALEEQGYFFAKDVVLIDAWDDPKDAD